MKISCMDRVNYLKNARQRVQIFRVSLYKNYCKVNLISAASKCFNFPAYGWTYNRYFVLKNSAPVEKCKEIM
jgi:hypothetical protein